MINNPILKDTFKKISVPLFFIVIFILSAVTVLKILPYEEKDEISLKRLQFTGTYQYSTTDTAKPYAKDTKLNVKKHDTLILKGTFDQKIAQDIQVIFMIRYLEVHIYAGEKEVFSFGEPGTYSSIMKSKGSSWGHFTMPFHTGEEQEWTIVLKNKYANNYVDAYQQFLNSMLTGDQGDLLQRIIVRNLFYVIPGFLFMIFGITMLLVTLILKKRKVLIPSSVPLGSAYTIAMSLSILLDPVLATLIIDAPVLIMFLESMTLLLTAYTVALYIRSFCSRKGKTILGRVCTLTLLFMIWYLSVQLLGNLDAFSFREYMIPFYMLILVCILVISIIEFRKSIVTDNRHVFLSFSALCVFYFFEMINYEIVFMPRSFFMTIGFVIFTLLQAYLAVKNVGAAILSAKQVAELEKELAENQIAIMLSQIQPHFLYNALNTIRYLCLTEPKVASTTVESFAKYLRANMDSLKQKTPIPFEQELNHLRNYLAIEQLRFDDVKIVYHLKTTDFTLPALTIQPLVENAIKYGVTEKDEGGTVTIETWEDEKKYYVKISDDGAGFDVNEKKKDGRSHIGVENTRERVAAMCGGTLEIDSRVGDGTDVLITLPKN